MSEGLLIQKIKDGTVIDHIPPGKALFVLKILGIDEKTDVIVSFAMNVPSRKMGRKDIVKVESDVGEEELNKIALIGGNVTINIIKDYRVVQKFRVNLPEEIVGVVRCPNQSCISNSNEPVEYRFRVSKKGIRCHYCGRTLGDEVEKWII